MANATETKPTVRTRKPIKLTGAQIIPIDVHYGNPWSPSDVDKLDSLDDKDFKKIVDTCRFFYRHDALSSSVINKMVEIGINELVFNKNKLTDNELRVFTAISDQLKQFCEEMALEYLISGLVVPEYKMATVPSNILKELGIKKYPSMILPVDMWLRDPKTITINKSLIDSKPSYFVEVGDELIYFIIHDGAYPDGTKDPISFEYLKAYYPSFVEQIKSGVKKVLLINPNIIRRKVVTDSPYPVPFLFSAIESLRHKRNLRRMDYSIASRVIGAIQLVKLGSDEFPVTEDEGVDQFAAIKQQMMWRTANDPNGLKYSERVFQLFANHTLQVEWVFPPVDALLNENKYKDVNQDIFFALGFPRILITGETEKSNASDAQYASMSPVKTMENMRSKIIQVLKAIVSDISKQNSFSDTPDVRFKPLQLAEFATFVTALDKLYQSGNLSREEYDTYFGYSFADEMDKKKAEQKILTDSGLPEFAPTPHSNEPNVPGQPNQQVKPKSNTPKQPNNQ